MTAAPPLYLPFIVAPPLTSCEDAYLVFGQGTPPYSINVIATGDATGASLEALPVQKTNTPLKFRTDFNEGANLTFALTDAAGQQAYSQFRVVQAGAVSTCPKTDYTPRSKPNIGAIVGGLFGALAAIALLCAFVWWRRRAWKKSHPTWGTRYADSKAGSVVDPDDVCLADGPAGVARAGTFNLAQVGFTEDSLTRLRAIDTPPAYTGPPRRASQDATVVPVVDEEEERELAAALAASERDAITEECRKRKARCSRTANCMNCRARGIQCTWLAGTRPSRTEEEATIEAQDSELRRLRSRIIALETQVVSLGGNLKPFRRPSASLGITTSPRGSVSLEVPPFVDRRDSAASWLSTSSDTSASSRRASSDELFPPVWSLSTSRSSLPLVEDEDEGTVPDFVVAELAATSLAEPNQYAFPRPPTLPPLALPALPTFPVSPTASSASPATQAGRWPPRRSSTLDPLASVVEWRVSAPLCGSAGPLSSPVLLGGCISPVLSLRTDA
ncbi:hypothetical protein JCM9279_003284 [Rhodotorula babjevae]